MKGVSVIICCYNSGTRVIPTLAHLALQKQLSGVPFEIIVVDNNCSDRTGDIAFSEWTIMERPYSLVIVQQMIAGLSHARDAGVNKAQYDYIVFCDDDNWLCVDYLAKVYHLFETHSEVALIGGAGEAVALQPLPEWFEKLKGFGYAIGSEGRKTGFVDAVYGAGMAVRKKVYAFIKSEELAFLLSDRKGKELSSGGDTEICMLIKRTGHQIYFDHSLTFKHFLTENRLNWSYYLRLRRAFGKASAYLQVYHVKPYQQASCLDGSIIKQLFSLTAFTIFHFKYIFFPFHFKTAHCADTVQQMSLRLTVLLNHNQLMAKTKKLLWNATEVDLCKS